MKTKLLNLVTGAALIIPLLIHISVYAAEMQSQPTPAAPNASASAEMQMKSIELTPEQVEAIQQAHKAHPLLPAKEVLRLIGVMKNTEKNTDVFTTQSYGTGTDDNQGNCSYIYLWGHSDGSYYFKQLWDPPYGGVYGVAASGQIEIFTDSVFSLPDYHFPEGPRQDYEGQLRYTGLDPTGTRMSGWVITTTNYLCYGELFAQWR